MHLIHRTCFTCPSGFVLKILNEEHSEVVAPSWPAIDDLQAKQALFKVLIKCFHSVGLFSKEDPNTPIGWCMQYPTGQPAHLYVTEPYRRRGFATLIMKHMCKCIQEDGLIYTRGLCRVSRYKGLDGEDRICREWQVYSVDQNLITR